jgi:hypothetical protein
MGRLLVGLSVAMIVLSGCDAMRGIPGSGVSKSESRAAEDFERLDVRGIGTIHVRFGDSPSLTVTCDDNLSEYVTTEYRDGLLRISLSESISPRVPLTFDLVTRDLAAVELSGAAKLVLHQAKLDQLKLSASGACDLTADGAVDDLEIDVSGAAEIDAANFVAKRVKISISGSGNADLHASESLDVTVSGAGTVNCAGNPKVTKQISGIGKVNVGTNAEAESHD